MHKICAREVKTTGMETAGNQWGGTNFRKRFINFKKMLAISKKYGIIMIVSFRKWISQAEIAQPVEHFTRNEGVVSSNLIFGLFFRNPQDVRFCGFSGIMRNMTEIRTPFAGKRSAAKGVCCYKFQEDQFVQHILTELLAGQSGIGTILPVPAFRYGRLPADPAELYRCMSLSETTVKRDGDLWIFQWRYA